MMGNEKIKSEKHVGDKQQLIIERFTIDFSKGKSTENTAIGRSNDSLLLLFTPNKRRT